MTYHGDVYDTPPTWLRALMIAVCLAGSAFMLSYVISHTFMIESILTVSGLMLVVYLILIAPTGSHAAFATTGYWALLGILVMVMPL